MSVKNARLSFCLQHEGHPSTTCAFCGRLTASLVLEVDHRTLGVFWPHVEVPVCLPCLSRAIDDLAFASGGQQVDSADAEQTQADTLPVYEYAVLNVPRKDEDMYKALQSYGERGWHLGSIVQDSQGLTPTWKIVFERDTNSLAPGDEEEYEEQEEEPVQEKPPLPPLAPPAEVHTKMGIPAPAETVSN